MRSIQNHHFHGSAAGKTCCVPYLVKLIELAHFEEYDCVPILAFYCPVLLLGLCKSTPNKVRDLQRNPTRTVHVTHVTLHYTAILLEHLRACCEHVGGHRQSLHRNPVQQKSLIRHFIN